MVVGKHVCRSLGVECPVGHPASRGKREMIEEFRRIRRKAGLSISIIVDPNLDDVQSER
jgi:hypothetical protein